jgi:transcriptional regulator with XRE-family HTH domain
MAKTSDGPPSSDAPERADAVAIFGSNLKAARLKLGMTQAQLAERSGLLQQYVSLVESGKQNVTLTTAETLAEVVGRNVSDMLRRPRTRSQGAKRD